MNHEVQVMEISRDARPEEQPLVIDRFAVSADTIDGARKAALARLASNGRVVRSLSHLAAGGLAAVVYPPGAVPTSAALKPRPEKRGR